MDQSQSILPTKIVVDQAHLLRDYRTIRFIKARSAGDTATIEQIDTDRDLVDDELTKTQYDELLKQQNKTVTELYSSEENIKSFDKVVFAFVTFNKEVDNLCAYEQFQSYQTCRWFRIHCCGKYPEFLQNDFETKTLIEIKKPKHEPSEIKWENIG